MSKTKQLILVQKHFALTDRETFSETLKKFPKKNKLIFQYMYCRHTLITNDKVPNFLLILNYLLYINDLKSKYFFGKNLQEYSFFF